MRFTVVCYRPDGEDSCMGCHMGSSSSAFALYVEETTEAAGLRIAEKRFADRDPKRDLAVCDWELTLLVDGAEEDYEDDAANEARSGIEAAAKVHFQRMLNQELERKEAERIRLEAAELAARLKKNEAKERHDRAEFDRLRAKFGPV